MELRILGPLQVVSDDGERLQFAPREMRVLAALLLAPNQVVTVQQLVDAVWGDDPPATSRRQIQNSVWKLRQQLPIRTDGPGYRIHVGDGELDAQVFENLVAPAHTAAASGNTAQAVDQLTAALQLWRGPALGGLSGRIFESAAARLEEQRLTAIEQCIDLKLALGRRRDLVGELTELVNAHPLREHLVALLMRALHATGRQAEALAAYQRLRTRLADELGIDPSPDLQNLLTAILRNELNIPLVGQPGIAAVPRQLPAPVRHFVGRAAELKQLTDLLDPSGSTVVITAISGTPGIGKTALALHWAHHVAPNFPDGQLYVNLRGFDPDGSVVSVAEAVRRFLYALDVPPQRTPADLDAQVDLYRTLLAGKRVLVVLDNARDAEQVRPLLPGSPGSMVLVTSRSQLASLVTVEGAYPLTLDLMSLDEAQQLLVRRLGAERLAGEPKAVEEIIIRCVRLPLALAIVAARAAANPTFPLSALAGQLRTARSSLDVLTGGDAVSDVRAVLSWSYHTLTAAAARLFRLLGLHPGPDFSASAAASLAACTDTEVRQVLAELTGAHLIAEHTPGRYTLHDLLRAYATELTHGTDPDDQRQTASHRMLDHYLHTAHTAAQLLDPHRDPITLAPPQPGTIVEPVAGYEQALAWLTTEHRVLLAMIDHAIDSGQDVHAWQLSWSLASYLDRRGHWHDYATAQRAAVAATRRLADSLAQAHAHRGLARAFSLLGRPDDARAQLQHAFDLYRLAGDQVGQARSHNNIAYLWQQQGHPREALGHALQALDLFRAAGHLSGQAAVVNGIGWLHAQIGDCQQALTHCQQALALYQELDDLDGEASAWDSLGYVHHHLGRHAKAITCYEHALDIFRGLSDRFSEAEILSRLGDTHHAMRDSRAARTAWQQALTILDELGHSGAEKIRTKLSALEPPDTPLPALT